MTVFVTVAERDSGEVLPKLGPYGTAAEARTGCAKVEGEPLLWRRDGRVWRAETDTRIYQVDADTQEPLDDVSNVGFPDPLEA